MYPPVTSITLFDAVAINEPIITVKVINAILFEKCFIPKNEEVNAAVIVGHEPYDIPVRQTPIMHNGNDPIETERSVTPAAIMVRIFAQTIVFFRPMASNTAPVIILPTPLHTERTPTNETANASGAFTDNAISFAKLITELPTAANKDIQIKAIQNEGRHSILEEDSSSCSTSSFLLFFNSAFEKTILTSGFFRIIPDKTITVN